MFTFDTATDLSANFDIDVISGDSGTEWHAGYGPASGFPGSDGGFVHFNTFISSNSLAFKGGPVFLQSFEISPQYDSGGSGVSQAIDADLDYHLRLYDISLTPILDTILTVGSTGAWETVTLNQAGVHAIWIARRDLDGTGTGGWWPNLDNITTGNPVPEPSTFAMGVVSLLGFFFVWRR